MGSWREWREQTSRVLKTREVLHQTRSTPRAILLAVFVVSSLVMIQSAETSLQPVVLQSFLALLFEQIERISSGNCAMRPLLEA